MSERRFYRCEWKRQYRGVYVEIHTATGTPDPKWVWHETEQEAREAEASRMRMLADHLVREAASLTRDRRFY